MHKACHRHQLKQQAGFTLIEMLAVTTILVMLLMTAATLFMNFMIGGAKTIALQKLKQESSSALQTMQQLIVNAKEVTTASNCTTTGFSNSSLQFTDRNNQTFTFSIADNKVASVSSALANPFYLTSDANQVDNLTFTCYTIPSKNSQYIEINLTLRKASASGLEPSGLTQTIKGSATIRNRVY